MPLYAFHCQPCAAAIDLFLSADEIDGIHPCPKCQSDLTRVYTVPGTVTEIDVSSIDPTERAWHEDNKRYIESRAQDVIDGKITLSKPKGPKELRPVIPHERKLF